MIGYGFVADLRAEVTVPPGGILSRTIHEDERCTLVATLAQESLFAPPRGSG